MNRALDFISIDVVGLDICASWFSDLELRRSIEPPTDIWFHYVNNTPGVYAWMVYEAGHPIGHIQLDSLEDQSGSFSVVVKPQLHNLGIGKRIIQAFLVRPEVLGLQRLVANVEQDNLPCQHCLQAVGFIQEGIDPDREGFLTFAYKPNHKA